MHVSRFTNLLCLTPLLICLTGCPDPAGEFDAFQERYDQLNPPGESSSTTGGGDCTVPAAGEVDGAYLFALSASIRPTLPVLYDAQLSSADGANGLELTVTLESLDARDRTTKLGDTNTYGPFAVDPSTGAFSMDFGETTIPGAGNPILLDQDIVGSVVADGFLCSPVTVLCGNVSGAVIQPTEVDLTGSTFTIEKLSAPGSYPDPPQINCNGDKAEAAPTDDP